MGNLNMSTVRVIKNERDVELLVNGRKELNYSKSHKKSRPIHCQSYQQDHPTMDNNSRLGYCTNTTCNSDLITNDVNSLPLYDLNDNDFDEAISLRFNCNDILLQNRET